MLLYMPMGKLRNGVLLMMHRKEHRQELDERAMREDAIIRQVAGIFRRLHTCGQDTHVPFDIFVMAHNYEKIIRENKVTLYQDYETVKDKVMRIKNVEDNKGVGRVVPCHNDPLIANWILADSGQLFLLDWEYAGMNDYMWDLSCVSIECNYPGGRTGGCWKLIISVMLRQRNSSIL